MDREFYAGMRRLRKPVELYYTPYGAHSQVQPLYWLNSAQGVVDWYRFWLKDDEDPDPTKAEQYKRWREWRKVQKSHPTRPVK